MGTVPGEDPPKMKIKRGSIANIIYSLIGDKRTGLAIDADGVTVLGNNPEKIPFTAMAGLSYAEAGLFLGSINVPLMNDTILKVRGLKTVEIKTFSSALNRAWRDTWCLEITQYIDKIRRLSNTIERIETPRRFPAACLMEPFLQQAAELVRSVPTNLPDSMLEPGVRESLTRIIEFHRSPEDLRDKAIDRFTKNELKSMAPFFEGIEKNPLTQEQRLAVVCDEDATLVLAGAGSGKTSVITSKAAYLIERGIRKPQEILLMAFGRDAAKEMSERVSQRCGVSIAAMTFHSLAYGIIAEVEGTAPPLARHATDDMALSALLREILFEQGETDPDKRGLLLHWFCEFFTPARNAWDFDTKHDYFNYIENHEMRTLQGEKVRSFEELEIANWLYMNGVDYEYEPTYEHDLPDSGRKAYTPDFRLKDSGVYIEHFGVRRQSDSEGNEYLSTAPFVDREKYLDGMNWKRNIHAEYGTTLIETFSYEKSEGCPTFNLREKLSPYVELNPTAPEKVLDRLREMGQVDSFTRTLATFLKHFKGAGLTLDQCRRKADNSDDRQRCSAFLDIFESLFTEYQKRLADRIDFEDMITRATRHIKANRYRSPYRHLLVDEFQDISQGRADLLLALKEQHVDSRIFAVGDDWQSIYRFSGSDIHLMRNFGEIFGGTFAGKKGIYKSVDLGRTFRSVDRIALPARSFVLKNPSQIVKNVTPAHKTTEPAIRIIWSAERNNKAALKGALDHIAKRTKSARASILLLGRYNWLHPSHLTDLNNSYPSFSLSFKSIHASKGLEADHVIILGADGGHLGLPSEIVDDPVLELVFPESNYFEHAEERRVFYVALTRARKSVTVIASERLPSCFVTEMLEHKEYSAMELGERKHLRISL